MYVSTVTHKNPLGTDYRKIGAMNSDKKGNDILTIFIFISFGSHEQA